MFVADVPRVPRSNFQIPGFNIKLQTVLSFVHLWTLVIGLIYPIAYCLALPVGHWTLVVGLVYPIAHCLPFLLPIARPSLWALVFLSDVAGREALAKADGLWTALPPLPAA